VRSARATGVWSPDSRIALTSAVDAGFPALWEEMARTSFRIHQRYLGLADAPVEFQHNYFLSDGPMTGGGEDALGFAHYGGRVRDLLPRSEPLEPGQHPFPVRFVRRGVQPIFNDCFVAGGAIETREFREPSELAALPQRAIINCTGYGARALWKDESLVPVRGQLAWLIPQPEVAYGLYYRGVGVVSRRDGLIAQQTGPNESYGYNDANESPDRAEADEAVRTIGALFPPRERSRA
jgi:D-amino-acid oxidase